MAKISGTLFLGPISGPVASALADIIPKIIIIRMHGEIM